MQGKVTARACLANAVIGRNVAVIDGFWCSCEASCHPRPFHLQPKSYNRATAPERKADQELKGIHGHPHAATGTDKALLHLLWLATLCMHLGKPVLEPARIVLYQARNSLPTTQE